MPSGGLQSYNDSAIFEKLGGVRHFRHFIGKLRWVAHMQARFYLPMYGRFASPDPARDQHFEETQSWNIYSYVQNNPVMYLDPNGETLTLASTNKQDISNYNKAVAYISKDSACKNIVSTLKGSSTAYTVEIIHDGNDRFDPNNNTVYWDPNSALAAADNSGKLDGDTQTPALGLGHELDHAYGKDQGVVATGTDAQHKNKEEKRVISGSETHAAGTLKEGTRTNHDGTPYESKGPTSRVPTKLGVKDLRKGEKYRGQSQRKYTVNPPKPKKPEPK